jgi:hypothetical protein
LEHDPDAGSEPGVSVGDDEFDSVESPVFEPAEELAP